MVDVQHGSVLGTEDTAAIAEKPPARFSSRAELLTRKTFAALLDIGVSTFDKLKAAGKIGPRPVTLAGLKWPREEVLAWIRTRAANGELYDAETWPPVWEAIRKRREKC